MGNWVNGEIIPYGTKEQIKTFTDYINSQEKWKYIVNRNCPPNMEENEIHIYANGASYAIEIAEEMEEKFRDIPFHFFVCDEMNGIGWGINFMNAIETCILYEENHDEDELWLEPTEITSEFITDKYIEERKKENNKECDPV